ncbi:MAG TPA: hypothetical protein IGS53_24125 [Leptolyngbyaceae cyanobacterium M33_DOE_097]|nr:hypothetical protein [Leptolyngbyaceae cyanobacterium M33_DOE_097]
MVVATAFFYPDTLHFLYSVKDTSAIRLCERVNRQLTKSGDILYLNQG